jgi:hypothetical protein
MTPPTRRARSSLWLSVLGLASLAYLLGAAVMFFHLPTSGFLDKAFTGARAWNEKRQVAPPASDEDLLPAAAATPIDEPGKTFDGFTLYAAASLEAGSTQVFVLNMRREVVHRWAVSFNKIWPNPPHLSGPIQDYLVCIFACHPFPNGDLLVVFHGWEQEANGYGLVKLDKDSNVLWKYAGHVHHDVDVGEDGTIYAIQHELADTMPAGLEFIPTPCLVDSLILLGPDGKPKKKPIPILEAFRDSPYAALLDSLQPGRKTRNAPGASTGPRFNDSVLRKDVLHMNCVQELRRGVAPKFPAFKAGRVLISLRHLDTVAVVDPDRGSVVWAARGPWRAQHDAQFLDNGHLLIFDNAGLPKGSRVLEYDPQTQALPWSYSGENHSPFYSTERGLCQRLPNGNTLVVNSEGGEILEVTRGKEVVWSCRVRAYFNYARRYSAAQLPFLKGDPRGRP